MMIKFLEKQNKEVIQVEPIANYLKELEERHPTILARWESGIFKEAKIDVQLEEYKIRMQIRATIPSMPYLCIRVYAKEDNLVEEITTILADIRGIRSAMINHMEFKSEQDQLIEKRYIYKNNDLSANEERKIELSQEEINEIIRNQYDQLSDSEKNYYQKEYGYTKEQAIASIKQKIGFTYLLRKLEEKRGTKIAFVKKAESPKILLKQFSEE